MQVQHGAVLLTVKHLVCLHLSQQQAQEQVLQLVFQQTPTFDIVKLGKDYTVTLRNGGAGYAVGDVVTINGASLGAGDDNDITITVHSVTDDSTNSIVTFEHSWIC